MNEGSRRKFPANDGDIIDRFDNGIIKGIKDINSWIAVCRDCGVGRVRGTVEMMRAFGVHDEPNEKEKRQGCATGNCGKCRSVQGGGGQSKAVSVSVESAGSGVLRLSDEIQAKEAMERDTVRLVMRSPVIVGMDAVPARLPTASTMMGSSAASSSEPFSAEEQRGLSGDEEEEGEGDSLLDASSLPSQAKRQRPSLLLQSNRYVVACALFSSIGGLIFGYGTISIFPG